MRDPIQDPRPGDILGNDEREFRVQVVDDGWVYTYDTAVDSHFWSLDFMWTMTVEHEGMTVLARGAP